MAGKTEPRFIVDSMLGRLSKWLRLLGFDAAYFTGASCGELALISLREGRVILTRDARLSSRRGLRIVPVTDDRPANQLRQVIEDLDLRVSRDRIYSRCVECNTAVCPVDDRDEVRARVPEHVFATHDRFTRCPVCGRVFWTGSHHGLLMKDLERAGIRIPARR